MPDPEHQDQPDAFDALVAQLDHGGRDFERLSRWFLEHDPEYATIFEQIWAWRDWPGRWGPDKGIDLIGRTRGGQIVAIQAKNYAERHAITKQDIDTFLSESGRPLIDERLLIATTDRVAANAIEVMEGQEKPVSRCLRSRLADARVTWPSSPHDLLGFGDRLLLLRRVVIEAPVFTQHPPHALAVLAGRGEAMCVEQLWRVARCDDHGARLGEGGS